MSDALLVTARLVTPLAGDAPRLDGLLDYAMSLHHPRGVAGHKILRDGPVPEVGSLPIPLLRRTLGGWTVGACSDPILAPPSAEWVEYVNTRHSTENAGMLRPEARTVMAVSSGPFKSYRIPLRIRLTACVRWFAVGDRRDILKLLRRECPSLGLKRSVGYGVVGEWSIERIDEDRSWYAKAEQGTVLMATLPEGPWLPGDLIGARRDFRAVAPPYWHLARRAECVIPC